MLTAQQNVELPLLLTNLSKKERAERTAIALGVVGLAIAWITIRGSSPAGRSSASRSRARSSPIPTLILLDEPTGQLDSKSSEEVLELLRRLNEEFHKTIMIVTHDAKAAERAKTVLHLEKGVLLERAQVLAGAAAGAHEISSARPRESQASQAAHDSHDAAAWRSRSSCSRRCAR